MPGRFDMDSTGLERIGDFALHRSMQSAEQDSLVLTFATMDSKDKVASRQNFEA